MDQKTRDALNAIEKISSSEDIIYEIFRTEKKSGWFHLWDVVFDVIPSTTTKLWHDKVMYLVASETRGTIVDIENGTIMNTIDVPGWSSDKKVNFKKVTIDNYIYKKYRKIS